jgi:hypothetical protein
VVDLVVQIIKHTLVQMVALVVEAVVVLLEQGVLLVHLVKVTQVVQPLILHLNQVVVAVELEL